MSDELAAVDAKASPGASHPLLETWRAFCDRLQLAGEAIIRADLPIDELDKAEGFRYLTRLLRIGLIQNLEAADKDFPFFFQSCDEITKWGGDDPDKVYLNGKIRGDRDYRITGYRGTTKFFSIGAKSFRMDEGGTIRSQGELNGEDMTFGPNGEVEIIVSNNPHPGNWLKTTPETNFLLIRQTFLDRQSEHVGHFKLEQIDRPAAPAPLEASFLADALKTTADFVVGNAWKWGDWMIPLSSGKNQLVARDQDYFMKVGGDPLINYYWGYFDLARDEAWVIDVSEPEAEFWSFTLYNWWQETFDYVNRKVQLNSHTAKRNPDGSCTLVIAAEDPGLGNWLDRAGHATGFALLRSYSLQKPIPTRCRVVKLNELRAAR